MNTWRELLTPAYMLTFLEAFLIAALPVLGLSSAITNGSLQPHTWPSAPAILAGVLVGGLNGMRAIKTLLTPPPAKLILAALLSAAMFSTVPAFAGSQTLGWDASTVASSYGVEQSVNNGVSWSAIAFASGPTCTTNPPPIVNRCAGTIVAPSTGLVLYRIWAENSVGRATRLTAGLWVCESCAPPNAPTDVEVK